MPAEPARTYQVGEALVLSELDLPAYDVVETDQADWSVSLAERSLTRPRPAARHGWYEGNHTRPWLWFAVSGGEYHLCFPRVADILISESRRQVRCYPAARTIGTRLNVAVQNQVLPLALGLHDWVLHASAVSDGVKTVLLTGDAGSGKSTLASYLGRSGWSLLADDAVVLREPWARPRVVPFGGALRLRPDSLERVLNLSRRRVPRLSGRSAKRLVPLELAGVKRPGVVPPVRRVYLLNAVRLAPGTPPIVEPLSAIEATLELVSATFTLKVDDPEAVQQTFHRITSLVAGVPVQRLRIPDGFDGLDAVARAIAD